MTEIQIETKCPKCSIQLQKCIKPLYLSNITKQQESWGLCLRCGYETNHIIKKLLT